MCSYLKKNPWLSWLPAKNSAAAFLLHGFSLPENKLQLASRENRLHEKIIKMRTHGFQKMNLHCQCKLIKMNLGRKQAALPIQKTINNKWEVQLPEKEGCLGFWECAEENKIMNVRKGGVALLGIVGMLLLENEPAFGFWKTGCAEKQSTINERTCSFQKMHLCCSCKK